MTRQLINPPELHPAPGFSHIARVTGDQLVFLSGQVALDRELNVVGGDDLAEQTRVVMRNLQTALAAAELGWEHVVRRTIYTTQPTEYWTIKDVIEEFTGPDSPPAQTVIGVVGLAIPGLMVEIELTAVQPRG
jgi:enamine deaminase RidA (YjgF/YER057c/UK114 family)